MQIFINLKNLQFILVVFATIIVTSLVQPYHGESQLLRQHSKYNNSSLNPYNKIQFKGSSNSNLSLNAASRKSDKLKKSNATRKRGTSNDQHLSCNSTLIPLTKSQAKLCHLYKDHMPFVDQGAKITIEECQYQLRKNRWNCSTIRDVQPVFGPIVQTGVKETAFLSALSSASIVYTVARACREGQLTNCGCSTSKKPQNIKTNWNWGGCGDNIEYAYRFSEIFADSKESDTLGPQKLPKFGNKSDVQIAKAKLDRKRLMNIHNNQAGRRAVLKKTKIVCKCHGVSDSCSMVTCWQQLPSFRDIGDLIKTRYDIATEVKFSQQDGKIQIRNKRQNDVGKPTVDDLIYIEQSPDFCNKIDKLKHPGTSGRFCNSSEPVLAVQRISPMQRMAEGSCSRMCCSRGFKTVRVIRTFKCNCKFKYCCKTECQSCYKVEMRSVCN